jgi:hypothetical protein
MNAAQIKQTFDLVGYVEKIVPLKPSKSYLIGPCPMCGGRDRFNIKKTNTGDIWVCRHCSPSKYRNALEFLMEYLRVDFKEALKRAGGELEQPTRQSPPQQPKSNNTPPSQDWQADAWKHVGAASDALLGIAPDSDPISSAGFLAAHEETSISQAARAYLMSRGIDRAAWASFQLGFVIAYKRPAVVVPYFDGNIIIAVKYRFFDTIARQDKGRRFSMLSGSKPYLFGLSHVIPNARNLLVIEGELNAISIIQQMPRGLATVSIGSETNMPAAALRKLADRYERVFIWMDDKERAQELQRRMGRDATILKSPIAKGQKYDANLMLQAGVLPEYLSRTFGTVCQVNA